MEKEVKALKEVYLNLWFRGLLYASLGILNMLYLVSDGYNFINGENSFSWMTLLNVVGVVIFSRSSVQLQNQRRVLFAKIKENL
jgi:hypothetical protein